MSADDISDFYVHTIATEPFLGTSGMGEDLFATSTNIDGFLDNTQKQVRDPNGEIVIAAGFFYTYPINAVAFSLNSRVTTASGVSRVLSVNLNDGGDLDLPDHLVVTLV